MKNPAHEQIQARKVKAILRMLQHAQSVSGNASQILPQQDGSSLQTQKVGE